jgi:CheY-like chemotaxis protein
VTLTRKRLLFVDDEPAIRITLSAILLRYGFKVTVAATVAEAIEEIGSQEFDVLLCDLNIDREDDGYDALFVPCERSIRVASRSFLQEP